MNGVQLQSRIPQPFTQAFDRLGVVVIEMRARREELDRFEPVCGNMHEVVACQTRLVKEMGGDAEAVVRQTVNVNAGPRARASGPSGLRPITALGSEP